MFSSLKVYSNRIESTIAISVIKHVVAITSFFMEGLLNRGNANKGFILDTSKYHIVL
jgi:hypothetical protein